MSMSLSTVADRRIRRVAITGAITVSLAAAVLSFNGLRMLAMDAAGLNGVLAVLYPISVDGMALVSALLVLRNSLLGRSTTYGWFLTLLGVGLSTLGNILSSPTHTLASMLVHASFPIIYALTFEALLSIVRRDVETTAAIEQERAAKEAAEAARILRERQDHERALRRAEIEAQRLESMPEAVKHGEEIGTVRAVVAGLPEDSTQIEQAMAILRSLPEVKPATLRSAGLSISYNTLSKARARLSEREQETESEHQAVILHAV